MQQLKKDDTLHGADRARQEHAVLLRSRVEQLVASGTPIALYLDIDGTLLDVALTPSTVHVPPDLADLLGALSNRLSGALAVITGRPIAEADRLLKPLEFVAAGVHGAEMRVSASAAVAPLTPPFNPGIHIDLKAVADALPGIVMEDKSVGIAMHYRLAPELRDSLLVNLEALIPKYPGQFTLCEGRKVIEILPVGFNKGHALRKVAELPQFANRVPVMIGDDIADIEAFRAAESLGGFGLKVAGENFTEAESSFIGPADVLEWLKELGKT